MRTTKTPRCSATSSRRSTRALLDRALAALVALQSSPDSEPLLAAARAVAAEYGAAAGGEAESGCIEALASFAHRTAAAREGIRVESIDSPYDTDRYLRDARELLPLSDFLLAVDTIASSTGLRDMIEAEVRAGRRLPSVRMATGRSEALGAYLRDAVGAVPAFGRILDSRCAPARATDNLEPLVMTDLFADPAAASFLRVNRYEGVAWFNRERYGDAVEWLALLMALRSFRSGSYKADSPRILEAVRRWIAGRNESGYRVDALLDFLAAPKSAIGAQRSSSR